MKKNNHKHIMNYSYILRLFTIIAPFLIIYNFFVNLQGYGKTKSIMIDDGTLIVSYEPLAELPNFFRSIISNVASREEDVYFMLSEVERLGNISWRNFEVILKRKRGR